jgi:membrane-bound lytic murein transglycosylase D
MARMRFGKRVRRWFPVVACAPLILLAGCPQENAAAPGKVPAQATAPASTGQPASADVSKAAAPVPTPAQRAEAAANSQRAQQLISRTEATYRTGVEDYRAGKLDAARQQFDLAVDTMLTSGLDLKGDPQLADEFDRLLSQVNALEMDALKQGNGFSPAVEAAPLDTADEVTFPANPELTAKLNAELKTTQSDFPLVVNDYVAGFISYFTNSKAGHAHLVRSLERAGKYKDMISKDLRDAGVPQDLMYLAVAESGFQPQAMNAKSGAGGMWQFMPTGAYGLARNGWLDERFDPEKSSKAYARYMKELYDQFGDWYLAMAAYDWGPGYVQRAVMHTGYADFWELYRRNALPAETKGYVPGIIAAIIMAKNPHQYGLDNLVPESPVMSDTVTVDYAVDLHLVADVTDARLEEVVALNPSLLRMRTPDQTPFDLHIPVGTKDVFLARMKTIPEEKRTSWRFHSVKPGESLGEIATNFHAKAADIAESNDLAVTDTVDPGDELVIPIVNAATGSHPQFYTLRRGDTLVTVADRFNVSVEDLRKWNRLKTGAVSLGRRLQVSQPVQLVSSVRTHGRGRREARGLHDTATVAAHGSKGSDGNVHERRVTKGESQRAGRSPKSSAAARGAHVEKTSSHPASAVTKHNKQEAAR